MFVSAQRATTTGWAHRGAAVQKAPGIDANSFQKLIDSVVNSAKARPSTPAVANGAGQTRVQDLATTSTAGQNPVTPAAQASATPVAVQPPLSPLLTLTNALQAAGIDPSSLNMSAHDEYVDNPGGHWTNHLITLTANGHTENFSADLTAKYPNVTVVEVQRLLRMA